MFRHAITLCVLFTAAATLSAEPFSVGQLGDARKLEFVGVKTFTPAQLAAELEFDIDYQRAATPNAPLREFKKALAASLKQGFRRAGFPRPTVEVAYRESPERMEVRVTEGPRCRQGEIVVQGNRLVSTEGLKTWLTSRQAKEDAEPKDKGTTEKPAWDPGRPAPFDPYALKKLHKQVARGLADQGFFFPSFEVEVRPRVPLAQAELVVRIQEEGPEGRLGEIDITGLKKNSRESLLKFLELREGMRLNSETVATARRMLIESARFWEVEVELIEPKQADDEVGLAIQLREFAPLPPLDEPLSEDDEAMLRIASWLTRASEGEVDLVFEYAGPLSWGDQRLLDDCELRVVLAPGRGAVVESLVPTGRGRHFHDWLLIESGRIGHYDVRHQQMFEIEGSGIAAKMNLHLLPDNSNRQEFKTSLNVGIGMNSGGDAAELTQFRFEPVVFLKKAQEPGIKVHRRGGIVHFTDQEISLKADEATGRVISLTVKKAPGLQVSTREGAFDEAVARLDKKRQTMRNRYQAIAPAGSLVDYALERWLIGMQASPNVRPETIHQTAVLRSLLAVALMEPIDRWREEFTGGDPDLEFKIPFRPDSTAETPMAIAGMFLPGVADRLLPREGWSWTLLREAGLVLAGRAEHTAGELRRVVDQPLGPLGHWALAELLAKAGKPSAGMIVGRGLARLGDEPFLADLDELLFDRPETAEMIDNVAARLRELSGEELEMLVSLLPKTSRPLAGQWIHAVVSDPERPAREAIREVALEYWRTSWREQVRAQLWQIARQPVAGKPENPER